MVGLTYTLLGLVVLMVLRVIYDMGYQEGRRDERRALSNWDSWLYN